MGPVPSADLGTRCLAVASMLACPSPYRDICLPRVTWLLWRSRYNTLTGAVVPPHIGECRERLPLPAQAGSPRQVIIMAEIRGPIGGVLLARAIQGRLALRLVLIAVLYLFVTPPAADAQGSKRIPRLCFLTFDPGTLRTRSPRFDAFFQELETIGYSDGRNSTSGISPQTTLAVAFQR